MKSPPSPNGKQPPAAKRPYTIKSAAAFLGLSDKTIRRLIKSGVLRASSVVKGKLLIPAADVENLVENTC
ncbi:MAG: helix-turn-helix domain-containing protein [Chthoniobacterales bacterium]